MALRTLSTDTGIDALSTVPHEPRVHPGKRPWLFTNMVASLDGAAAVDGLSGPMGDADDREMFRALRASADAILVGAGTVTAENYQPPGLSAAVEAARSATGRIERPLVAVVSASLSIDPDADLFSDPSYRPMCFTTQRADPKARSILEERADIVELGPERVDLAAAIAHLGDTGHSTVLSEGGPSLNGQLAVQGLVDEWNLTVAPLLVGGDAPRTAHGRERRAGGPTEYRLTRLYQGERSLFGRWVRT